MKLGGFRGEHGRQARCTDAMEEGQKRYKRRKNQVRTFSCTKGQIPAFDFRTACNGDESMVNLLINSNRLSTNRVEILFGTTWMNLQTDIRLIQEFEERYMVNGKVQRRFVDFAHPETKTAIELDGSVHQRLDVQANDFKRQREMESIGWTFIRFSNPQILRDPQGCAQFALQCIQSRQHLQPVQHCSIPASFPQPAPRRRRYHHKYRQFKRKMQQLFAAAVVLAAILFLVLLAAK